jgi:porin
MIRNVFSLAAAVAVVALPLGHAAEDSEDAAQTVELLTQAQTDETGNVSVASDANEAAEFFRRRYQIGYSRRPVFGGPNSPEGQLEESDRVKEPAFRFPAIYDATEPWREWKRRRNEVNGLQISGHYTTLYQALSESIGEEDEASSGVFRTNVKWTVLGRGTADTGSIVTTVDHRHRFRDIAPADLAGEAGYAGVTGLLYNDAGGVLVNLNWQQGFKEGNIGLIAGRYDPSDYFNILGYANPWTTFSNLSVLLDSSVAYPDVGWGIGAGSWFEDQWYVLGGFNDANGKLTDDLEFYDGGAEFFKFGEIGWSPSKEERYFRNAHVTVWHVDEREDAGIDSAQGVLLAANWTFDDTWMPFVRAGFSDGGAPIYNTSATVGFIRRFAFRSDLAGIGINWGDPPASSLPEQITTEAFWRFQFAPNFAITPSVQWLIDPALNDEDDEVWVYGLRMRLTF